MDEQWCLGDTVTLWHRQEHVCQEYDVGDCWRFQEHVCQEYDVGDCWRFNSYQFILYITIILINSIYLIWLMHHVIWSLWSDIIHISFGATFTSEVAWACSWVPPARCGSFMATPWQRQLWLNLGIALGLGYFTMKNTMKNTMLKNTSNSIQLQFVWERSAQLGRISKATKNWDSFPSCSIFRTWFAEINEETAKALFGDACEVFVTGASSNLVCFLAQSASQGFWTGFYAFSGTVPLFRLSQETICQIF